MTNTPPASPTPSGPPQRPMSAMIRPPRSTSRMSMSSKQGGGSRASDEDGKTAVKVAVRVRPPLKPTDPGYDLIPQRFQRSTIQCTSPTSLAVDAPQGRKLFVFDRVFGESVDQEGVWEYLHESVHSFLQGYNVSILAYGQSGAGKSYTMGTSGPDEQNDSMAMGIIPRAAQVLFEKLMGNSTHKRTGSSGLRTPSTRFSANSTVHGFGRGMADKDWQMKATYVEIYNEQLRDLLIPESTPANERNIVSIREDTKGRILLTGLHQVNISSIEDLLGALNFGSSIRQTDATAINAKSSRSHAVFSLNLVQRKDATATMSSREKRLSMPVDTFPGSEGVITVDSKLHFVDLAGSERLKNTGASGERAKEGISINAGLASLGKVIAQLSSRQPGSHVSYRDSKLTRLLQDSLGGSAITYMVACVHPAEFHLSETLNTVQYAQRARAIQSKPRIQQVADDSDKQAIIDRLKAEVAFLRQQIRSSENGDRRANAPQERAERQTEREIELQNHLLDMQESYGALSQRHAKLISELTKNSDFNGELEDLHTVIGVSAMERLKRSSSFAESVEQVVLEYEKTIQSLESSLSQTRSSLANTESNLLERETKCAYVETVNAQLQARMQKMMEREANTEHYLHELESKLDGHSTGEEKNAAIIGELRKEIVRARENEASCEDYISTLEERLAEADQDMELMQREIDRLEHVVDRQRSLGKLDNLLYELDHIQQNGTKSSDDEQIEKPALSYQSRQSAKRNAISLDFLKEAAETAIPEDDEEFAESAAGSRTADLELAEEGEEEPDSDEAGLAALEKLAAQQKQKLVDRTEEDYPVQSPAQSRLVADKLENVTQELFDLRIQHDSSLSDYELLNAKYEEALRTLAELQDAVDEARHQPPLQLTSPSVISRPVSYLESSRLEELRSGEGQSSTRSLSSELSLAGESVTSPETTSDRNSHVRKLGSHQPYASETNGVVAGRDLENMRRLLQEHQEGMSIVTQQYAQLQAEHEETLGLVEELKVEVHRAKYNPEPSPTHKPHVIRRMTSQNMTSAVDRAHRSLASLRNLAVEQFEDQPETLQNFELNVNTAMHELHFRMERIQALEAEIKSVKKEMETKSTIISGLTRERSSLQAAPMDIAVVAQMQEQIVKHEAQMKEMQEEHENRENRLAVDIRTLNELLDEQRITLDEKEADVVNHLVKIAELKRDHSTVLQRLQSSESKLQSTLTALEAAVAEKADFQTKHHAATESLASSEKQLQSALNELNDSLAKIESLQAERNKANGVSAEETAAISRTLEEERSQHQALVENLNKDIDQHKTDISTHLVTIAGLETAVTESKAKLAEHDATVSELESYRNRVTELEQQIDYHKSSVDAQKAELASLQQSHEEQRKELEVRIAAEADAKYEQQLAEENTRHEQALNGLRAEALESKDELARVLDSITKTLDWPVTADTLQEQLEDIVTQKRHIHEKYSELIDSNEQVLQQMSDKDQNLSKLQRQVTELGEKAAKHEAKVNELALLVATHEDTLKEKEEIIKKKSASIEEITLEKDKSRRLVEELEEQITSTFDQHHNRLSVIQQERNKALEEANLKVTAYERDIEAYRVRIEQLEGQLRNGVHESSPADRSSSMSSNLRKSTSVASLPSPPPAIPLPPLPSIAAATNAGSISPPSSRHTSKELVNAQLVEDQEARIRTIEKHLHAEKQLTATLEEALGDLEAQSNKAKADMEAWKKRAWQLEEEMTQLRNERNSARLSIQAVEEERNLRREAEAARAHLEEKMNAINKKKKKSTLNCF